MFLLRVFVFKNSSFEISSRYCRFGNKLLSPESGYLCNYAASVIYFQAIFLHQTGALHLPSLLKLQLLRSGNNLLSEPQLTDPESGPHRLLLA